MKSNLAFLSLLLTASLSAQAQQELIPTVEIPAGTFWMGGTGAGENYDEAPMHRVTISRPFRMGVTEVTNAQYEQFRPEHRELRGKRGFSTGDDEAVVFVSYDDAVAFCRWLSEKEGKTYRLPTEAEWEYACRAGTLWNFWMGDKLLKPYDKNQVVTTSPKAVSLQVAQQPANPWGLYDMSGNVEEWCADWYGPYMPGWQTDPVGYADGNYRVTRGGSHNTPTNYLRSGNRSAMIPEDMCYNVGFRVVQADYPTTELLPVVPDAYAVGVSHEACDWEAQHTDRPVFEPYIVYVNAPTPGSGTPFYSHNHQPAITWCDNGDLLAIWFSTDDEKGRELTVLSSRLRKGSREWEPARLFYKVPDRNMTGSALFNDGQGTLYHINGVEALGGWKNLAMTLRTSTDNGATWSKPRLIAPEHTLRHQVIAGLSRRATQVRAVATARPSTSAKTRDRRGPTRGTAHPCRSLPKEPKGQPLRASMPAWCNCATAASWPWDATTTSRTLRAACVCPSASRTTWARRGPTTPLRSRPSTADNASC